MYAYGMYVCMYVYNSAGSYNTVFMYVRTYVCMYVYVCLFLALLYLGIEFSTITYMNSRKNAEMKASSLNY